MINITSLFFRSRAYWILGLFCACAFAGMAPQARAEYVSIHPDFNQSASREPLEVVTHMIGEIVQNFASPVHLPNSLSEEKEIVKVVYAQGAGELVAAPAHVLPRDMFTSLVVFNETLSATNDAMFALYAKTVADILTLARFDAEQFAYVWDKTFGEFGERYVSDLNRFADAEAHWYFSLADALQEEYDHLAHAIENVPTLDSSISVASIANAPDIFDFLKK